MKDDAKERRATSGEPRPHTDEALASEFALRTANFLRYVPEWGRWMVYDGATWGRDEIMTVIWEARCLAREDAEAAPKALQAKVLSVRTVNAIVSLARSAPMLSAVVDQWDDEPMALNCLGEVHQLNADSRPRLAVPGDYFTKSTAVKPAGDCPMWIEFLETVTAGDAELVDYLQRMAGYCLTGSTAEQCLFFLYGPGGNGKSTFVNTISGVLGDYARTAAIDTFAASNGHDRHPTDLASLQGARLVTATETAEGRRWDETRIKTLTGGDMVSARFMRQDFFRYRPAFKLVISGNHKPQLRGVDEAWRRRMQIVPFTVRILPERRILDLEWRLRDEWPGILAWMIDGARYWHRSGLKPPPAVTSATEEYLENEDVLGGWIEETVEFVPHDDRAFLSREQLFGQWQIFCKNAGEHVGSRKQFVANLNRREGFVPHKNGIGVRGYRGIQLRPLSPSASEFGLS